MLVAPLILLNIPGFIGGDIEATAPQALIYGWVLQFGFALIPFLVQRYLLGDREAGLGGNWFSLLAINGGSVLIWASIFVVPLRNPLHSAAYLVYVLAMLPVAWQLGQMLYGWFQTLEQESLAPAGD